MSSACGWSRWITRGQPGDNYQPFVLDDSDLNAQPIVKLKSFLDVGEEEVLTRERWGGSKMVRNQVRIACDNKCDPRAEPQDDMPEDVRVQSISVDYVYDVLRPCFPNAGRPDVDAIFKRATVLINSKTCILRQGWRGYGEQALPRPLRLRVPHARGRRGLSQIQAAHELDYEQQFVRRASDLAPQPARRWKAGAVQRGHFAIEDAPQG